MAKLQVLAGATSQSVNVFIRDSTSTTGAGLAAVAPAGGSLLTGTKLYYSFTGANASAGVAVSLSVLAAVNSIYTSAGIVTLDATNMIGWVRIDIPDAALAGSKGRVVSFHLYGGTNMAPTPFEIELTAWNNQDAVRGGLSALPNANAAAANGLPVLGTNATAISFTAGMTVSSTTGTALTLSSSGGNGNGAAISGNGSGDGAVITGGATGRGIHALGGATSGGGFRAEGQGAGASGIHALGFGALGVGMRIEAGTTGAALKILGGTVSGSGVDLTTTSGDGLNITPTAGSGLILTGDGTSKFGAIITGGTAGTSDGIKAVAGSGGVDIRGNRTGNLTGNVSGSVGSVTGAVGSVTGAVGSVTGTTGDFTTALTESYATDGSTATPAQLLYMLWSLMAERNISSTTLTAKKLDGSTSAMTFTLDSATAPTTQTRAS